MQLRNHNKELEIILNNEKSSRSNLMSSLTNTKERTESYKRDNEKYLLNNSLTFTCLLLIYFIPVRKN